MNKVIECARALGEAIVASEEYRQMQITENAAMSDPTVTEAMGRYLELKSAVEECMRAEEPNPELIAQYGMEMDEAQRQMNAMPAVDAMTASRQRFSEMMNQVNHVMQFIITGEVESSGGCSGNCGSCGGCH